MRCPQCGRTYHSPGLTTCPACQVPLSEDLGPTPAPREADLQVDLAPIVREALASRRPDEDLDEALLRALKAKHPEHALSLLPALTRIIELESQRAHQDKHQAAARLAQRDSGLRLHLKTSRQLTGTPGNRVLETSSVTDTTVINIGGREYHSLEEVPAHLRPVLERAMKRTTPPSSPLSTKRVGCSIGLLALPLLFLTALLHR